MKEKKELKCQNKTVTDMLAKKKVLSDAELEDVAGGFVDGSGWAQGKTIVCPNCGEYRPQFFSTWIESDYNRLDGYQCLYCGFEFGVDVNGQYWW